jgi:hypothetical protein
VIEQRELECVDDRRFRKEAHRSTSPVVSTPRPIRHVRQNERIRLRSIRFGRRPPLGSKSVDICACAPHPPASLSPSLLASGSPPRRARRPAVVAIMARPFRSEDSDQRLRPGLASNQPVPRRIRILRSLSGGDPARTPLRLAEGSCPLRIAPGYDVLTRSSTHAGGQDTNDCKRCLGVFSKYPQDSGHLWPDAQPSRRQAAGANNLSITQDRAVWWCRHGLSVRQCRLVAGRPHALVRGVQDEDSCESCKHPFWR